MALRIERPVREQVVEPIRIHLRNGGQQQVRILVVWWHEDVRLRSRLHDAAFKHDHDVVGNCTHCTDVMRDEYVREIELALQPIEELQDLLGDELVQRRRHFVADDEFRLGG